MIFILDHMQNTVAVADNKSPSALPYFDDKHTENLKGVNTYEFKIPAQHPDAEKVVENGHVIIRDLDGEHVLFTIKNINENYSSGRQIKEIACELTAIDELLTDVVRPVNMGNINLQTAVERILSYTVGWKLNRIEYTSSFDVIFEEPVTVLEALNTIMEQFSHEMYFTVKLNGTKIVEKQVNVVKERGIETNVRFDYGKHVIGVSRTTDTTGIITAIIPYGKGADDGSGRVNITKVDSFDDGNFYHVAGTDWIGSEEALQRWAKTGKHLYGTFIDDEVINPLTLKEKAIRELKDRSQPYVNYACSIVNLERYIDYEAQKLRIGDRILVKDITYNPPIVISARVQEISRSYTNPQEDTVDLGKYKPVTTSLPYTVKRLQNTISRKEHEWSAKPYQAVIQSTGGDIFKNGSGTSILTALVYRAGKEIDSEGTFFVYRWYKYGPDGNLVYGWGGSADYKSGKSITVTDSDVTGKATYICEIDDLE